MLAIPPEPLFAAMPQSQCSSCIPLQTLTVVRCRAGFVRARGSAETRKAAIPEEGGRQPFPDGCDRWSGCAVSAAPLWCGTREVPIQADVTQTAYFPQEMGLFKAGITHPRQGIATDVLGKSGLASFVLSCGRAALTRRGLVMKYFHFIEPGSR